jgi:hypothetical protein
MRWHFGQLGDLSRASEMIQIEGAATHDHSSKRLAAATSASAIIEPVPNASDFFAEN